MLKSKQKLANQVLKSTHKIKSHLPNEFIPSFWQWLIIVLFPQNQMLIFQAIHSEYLVQ